MRNNRYKKKYTREKTPSPPPPAPPCPSFLAALPLEISLAPQQQNRQLAGVALTIPETVFLNPSHMVLNTVAFKHLLITKKRRMT